MQNVNHHFKFKLHEAFCRVDKKKIFIIAACINFILYWCIGVVGILFPNGWMQFSDFYTSIKSTAEKFLLDPSSIYFPADAFTIRFLPFALFYYLPFVLGMPTLESAYLACSFMGVLWNGLICFLLYKILESKKIQDIRKGGLFKHRFALMTLYIMIPWHLVEYWMVNTDYITMVFILYGIYLYIEDHQAWAFFSWSFGITFKIFPVFFLLMILFDRSFVRVLKNIAAVIAAQMPNIILFLVWPRLLVDYIFINLAISTDVTPDRIFASGSLTRDISTLFTLPLLPTVVVIALILVPVQLYYILIEKKEKFTIIDRFTMIFLLGIAIVPEFYTVHTLDFLCVYILWLGTGNHKFNNKIKLIPAVATFFIIPWIVLRYFSILFFTPLLLIDFSILRLDCRKYVHPKIIDVR